MDGRSLSGSGSLFRPLFPLSPAYGPSTRLPDRTCARDRGRALAAREPAFSHPEPRARLVTFAVAGTDLLQPLYLARPLPRICLRVEVALRALRGKGRLVSFVALVLVAGAGL